MNSIYLLTVENLHDKYPFHEEAELDHHNAIYINVNPLDTESQRVFIEDESQKESLLEFLDMWCSRGVIEYDLTPLGSDL
ncbi:MAG: hypothetical protein R3213_09335 [Flavobacteriaceae bacterium]|nr:hypothetical protein [Flavobacteriaceae bacterium]